MVKGVKFLPRLQADPNPSQLPTEKPRAEGMCNRNYCENQTGKTDSKKVEAKTVTPVDSVNKTIFSIWHHGWIRDLSGAI